VLIHLKASTIPFARSRQSPASNYLAARIGAFEAWLCHAKITPAARWRGGPGERCREDTEAVGSKPKFEPSDFQRGVSVAAERVVKTPAIAAG
jgi:hypothetical protein